MNQVVFVMVGIDSDVLKFAIWGIVSTVFDNTLVLLIRKDNFSCNISCYDFRYIGQHLCSTSNIGSKSRGKRCGL